MPDDPKPTDVVPFVVSGIHGLYVPFVGGFVRLVAPKDLPAAQQALANGQKAWLN